MAEADKTVFLSYRRDVSWAMAHLVRNDLVAHGFDVFMDVHGIDTGEFERVIMRQIAARTHFVLLLEPRSLDRVGEPDDWLRRELAYALLEGRNVVPLLAEGARIPRAANLPADLARLTASNAVSVPHEYFAEAMQKLRERFLRAPDPIQATTDGSTSVSGLFRSSAVAGPTFSQRRGVDAPLLVTLVWTAVDRAVGYEVEQSSSVDFPHGRMTSLSGTTHHDVPRSELDRGRFFRVRALTRAGPGRAAVQRRQGPWSNIVVAR